VALPLFKGSLIRRDKCIPAFHKFRELIWELVSSHARRRIPESRPSIRRFQRRSTAAASRRPPWTVEELDACFVVRNHSGQKLAYVYFEEEPGRRSAAKLIASTVTNRLPDSPDVLPGPP
jgi:hypothetical protein